MRSLDDMIVFPSLGGIFGTIYLVSITLLGSLIWSIPADVFREICIFVQFLWVILLGQV